VSRLCRIHNEARQAKACGLFSRLKANFRPQSTRRNEKGQATAELAILGAIIIMLVAYLLQQGFLYNAKQSLEMYAFRQALRLSQQEQRGITLTVIRDVMSPSFFTGLTRQRIMATSSVEYNPWVVYTPDRPEDIASRRLFQIGDAMINSDTFYEIPPTKVKVDTNSQEGQWYWETSAIGDIDPQSTAGLTPQSVPRKTITSIDNTTIVSEDAQGKTVQKNLKSTDSIPTIITFDDAARIEAMRKAENAALKDGNSDSEAVKAVSVADIPFNVKFQLEEIATRSKQATTLHK